MQIDIPPRPHAVWSVAHPHTYRVASLAAFRKAAERLVYNHIYIYAKTKVLAPFSVQITPSWMSFNLTSEKQFRLQKMEALQLDSDSLLQRLQTSSNVHNSNSPHIRLVNLYSPIAHRQLVLDIIRD